VDEETLSDTSPVSKPRVLLDGLAYVESQGPLTGLPRQVAGTGGSQLKSLSSSRQHAGRLAWDPKFKSLWVVVG
jgi:hypothetical protein